MTVFYYIIIAMLSALALAAAVCIVFKAGEEEFLTKYGQEDGEQ